MAAGGKQIEQVHVIDDHHRMGFQRIEDQLVKCLLQRQRMFLADASTKSFMFKNAPPVCLCTSFKNGGLAAADSAPHTEDGADLETSREAIKGSLLFRTQLDG